MNTGAKLGAYAAVLVVALGGGAGLGAVAGPIDVDGDDEHVEVHDADTGAGAAATGDATTGVTVDVAPPDDAVQVGDVEVTLAGDPHPGVSELAFTARRDGAVVDPAGGAGWRLVAVDAHDLAPLHVHPAAGDTADGAARFSVEFPAAGTYRLFLDLADGESRPAAFTVVVPEAADGAAAPADPPADHTDHDENPDEGPDQDGG